MPVMVNEVDEQDINTNFKMNKSNELLIEELSSSSSSSEHQDLDSVENLITLDELGGLFNFQLNDVTNEPRTPPIVLDEANIDGIVKYIEEKKCKNIITMAGAGLSTSAGIPDFRSPVSGLYHNLQKYKLPYPQAIFEINFLKENPKPFFELAKELYPGNFRPTIGHYFVKLLEEKGLLLRHYTQNIDTLDRMVGISDDKLVEAHGSFHTSHCINCAIVYDKEWVKDKIFSDTVPMCNVCNGIVKPDIVFFGESLPRRFFHKAEEDTPKCDLLIIMGCSLAVQPFASLKDRIPDLCPRLLINRELVGQRSDLLKQLGIKMGGEFEPSFGTRDVFLQGSCDDGCQSLAEKLGWGDDLRLLIQQGNDRISSELVQKQVKVDDPCTIATE